jgi:thiamine pyrophosphokinase
MKKCIILANGKPPKKSVIAFFRKLSYNKLICADGGANSALKMNLVPDVIIGDLDSISANAIKEFKSVCKIIRLKRQNDTDVEKCLKYAIKNNFNEAMLVGVTGNRLDHTFCNLGIVKKFSSKIDISLVAENSYLKSYKGKVIIKTHSGETISIYAFDHKTKITSSGLKYKLNNVSLPFGKKESTSNVATSDFVKLNINGGSIFVIRDVNLMMKYDLF